MYLKSLTLRGFKSFADRTSLSFEPGITVIVGPNGSGKSNITDAVLWVLGEQSARSLRGSSMEDVIFAGSSGRPPLGMAEVTICLDNSENKIPIEFSEVTISRRILRSGESEYCINNSPCRLMDIQELLSDSALGREMYSIVSQGRLEEVLNSKPEDRRSFIDEVAGILKYRRRKDKALKKMASVEQNIIRLKDILKEVEKQVRPLRAQANQAEIFNQLSAELRDVEISLVVAELKQLQAEWEAENEKAQRLQSKLQELKNELALQLDAIKRLKSDLEREDFDTVSLQDQNRELERYLERLMGSMLLLEEKERNSNEKVKGTFQEIDRLKKRLSSKEQELFMARNELKNTSDELDKIKCQVTTNRFKWEQTNIEIVECEKELDENRQLLEKTRAKIKEIILGIESDESVLGKIKNELNLFTSRMQTSRSRAEEAIQIVKDKKEVLASLKSGFSEIIERLRNCMHSGYECKYILEVEGLKKRIESLLESEIKAIEARLDKRRQIDEMVSSKVQQTENQIISIEKKLECQYKERDCLSLKADELEQEITELWRKRDELKIKAARLREEQNNEQIKITMLTERQGSLERQIASLKAEVREVEGERDKLLQVAEKSKEQVERLSVLKETFSKLIACAERKINLFRELMRGRVIAYSDIQRELEQAQMKEGRVKEEIATLQERLHQHDLSITQLELKVQSAVQKIVEEYNLPLERTLDRYPGEIDVEQSKSRIRSLKSKIGALGPINPIAIEEYKALEERHNFLLNQSKDLINSRKVLLKIIKEIDKKIEGSFLQTFKEVNENFQALFSYLFPGGKAELVLTNPDNLLDTGVDIEVFPDGRKSQKLSLLSGGERALAALAFLFAMYQTRPSPFYILDEVEAALDDVNVQRFIALLEQMKEKAQFLIITHQKRTMEAANSLYGVTMQADGVSRLISQKVAHL